MMTATPRFLSREIVSKIYFAGLLLLVVALPLSKFVISVSQFMILGSWLLSGDFRSKYRAFISCRPAVFLVLVWLMHVAGLIYTTDFAYAFKDLRIKLPLLALPVILSTAPPLTRKQFENILLALVSGTVIAALAGFITWMGWTGKQVNDVRDIALFVSHIRLSLLICLSIFVCIWFAVSQHRHTLMLIPVMLFLLVFLFILESLTGLIILSIVLLVLGLRRSIYLESGYWKWILMFVSVMIPAVFTWYVYSIFQEFNQREKVDYTMLPLQTPSGNPYMHYSDRQDYENGNLIWIYVCEDELQQQWDKRSKMKYMGLDARGQELRFTLIRYMTSRGLKKDSAAVWALTENDIKTVEKGIANINYTGRSILYGRIQQVIWEIERYSNGGDPSGHSVTMRWEYWKTAVHIIRENPIFGVGTGDVPAAFREQYIKDGSMLTERWRLRAHNQYLSLAVAFGLPGMLFFIVGLIYVLRNRLKNQDTLFLAFWLIAVVSMLTEDTLETQAGVTFFALFYCLFLFVNPQKRSCGGNIR
jgi:hypothetical protein